MAEAWAQALSIQGLWLIVLGAALSGLVRGFSGFGTALVFIPLAAQVIPPIWVFTVLVVMDTVGPAPNLPRAVRTGDMGQVGLMVLGAVLCLPVGLAILLRSDPDLFRYAVSTLAIVLPLILMTGWRYRGAMSRRVLLGTGAASGFLGGVVGLPGPPVILLYMAGQNAVAMIRANTMVYLFAFDALLLALLAVQGRLEPVPVMLGLMMALPNLAGNLTGAALFNPAREGLYRAAGYTIILAAAISGLPLWD